MHAILRFCTLVLTQEASADGASLAPLPAIRLPDWPSVSSIGHTRQDGRQWWRRRISFQESQSSLSLLHFRPLSRTRLETRLGPEEGFSKRRQQQQQMGRQVAPAEGRSEPFVGVEIRVQKRHRWRGNSSTPFVGANLVWHRHCGRTRAVNELDGQRTRSKRFLRTLSLSLVR